MRTEFLAFGTPSLGEAEIDGVVGALRSGWITAGPAVANFEESFAQFVGAESALALNSGTAALHLALIAHRIGSGDAVVTSPMTFCSSAHVIEHVGARPLFVDVAPDTLNIDPAHVERTLSKPVPDGCGRAAALMAIHLYGHPANMKELDQLALRHDLHVIEDAAHALPARIGDHLVGARRNDCENVVAFSFYATKNMTTGDGGMLTGPRELIDTARTWSLHGMSKDAYGRYSEGGSWSYEVVVPGFKYNMTDIQAALGLAQLGRLPDFHARRVQIAARYAEAFAGLEEVEPPITQRDVSHAWHLYVLRLHLGSLTIDRARFITELNARKIGTSVHFIPLHVQPYYRDKYGYKPDDFPVAWREFQRIISLPIYPKMTDADVDDVVEAVTSVVAAFRR